MMWLWYNIHIHARSMENIDDKNIYILGHPKAKIDMASYASIDSTEYTIICDHDTIISTSLTEAMEVEEFMNFIRSEEYMDLPKLMPIISTDELQSRIVSNCNIVASKQTCALSSALNPESPPFEIKEDAILTRRRVAKKNNSNSTDENEDDKKPLDYQSAKNKIRPFVPRCLPKVKKILYMCIILVFLCLTFIFQYTVSSHKNHKDNNTSIIGEWKKEILDLDEIVQFLAEYLQQDSPLLKVVALIGGTSSDKSYTVDIIRNRLRRRRKSNNFSPLYSDLIVLKNLRDEHSIMFTKCVINFVKRYQKAYGDQRLTILTVYKVEQVDGESTPSIDLHRAIKDTFLEANINIKIIPYEPLNEETLEKYIINTAENIRLTLSQDQIDVIKRRLIEDTDWRFYSNVGSELTMCD